MPESEKRTPISVYLTPKGAMILKEYNRGSGYGSISRTVEEIIFAFDLVYENMKTLGQFFKLTRNVKLSDKQKLNYFLMLFGTLQNLGNAISRLQKEVMPTSKGVF